ncbi:hypothetical protein MBLNU230_g3691t1 [Neophaeotheca triangularis]
MSDTKIIHCVRHAQGYHNLNIANHALRDPKLTSYGEEQCRRLAKDFPSKSVDLIVASPIVRTLNTSLIGFEEVIKSKGLKVVAIPELQETSDLPCDTGSSPEDLAKVYEGKPVDLSRVKADWTDKQGKFAPTASAIEARAKEARQWLMARPEKEIVVVTHGGFLHYFTEDWTGDNRFPGTGWANTELRSYNFNTNDADPRLVELTESRRRRLGDEKPMDQNEQANLKRSVSRELEGKGYVQVQEIKHKIQAARRDDVGAYLVKDRLVQACMRLRKLGQGQTVIFLVPDEIARKVTALGGKPAKDLTSLDILHWSISEMFQDARKSMPLWSMQGYRFTQQKERWNGLCSNNTTEDDARQFLEPEAQTLEYRYRPKGKGDTILKLLESDNDSDIVQIRERYQMKCHLLATDDYAKTVLKTAKVDKLDLFQRPAQFLLRSKHSNGRYIIISPFEGNALMPAIMRSAHTQLCLYNPRINLDHTSTDRLDFMNVPCFESVAKLPKDIRLELMLFSGQLYLTSYTDYVDICKYLGLLAVPTPGGWKVAADGYILEDNMGRKGGTSRLTQSPVGFLKAVMTRIRGGSADIQKTHVGSVLSWQVLQAEDFEVQE